jgi:phage terminase small subunit
MPALRNSRHERLAQERALGRTLTDAWEVASGKRNVASASGVGRRPDVAARIAELRAEQEAMRRKAIAEAAARFEVTAERVIGELAKIAFANLTDFVKIGQDGKPRTDFSTLTFDQGAALQILTVEETKGGGRGLREIRRVKFKLGDKRLALIALGNHLGLFGQAAAPAHAFPVLRDRIASQQEWDAAIAKDASRA